jgi:hypothetical protein
MAYHHNQQTSLSSPLFDFGEQLNFTMALDEDIQLTIEEDLGFSAGTSFAGQSDQ